MVEHEYARGGAWAYLAALDVHRAKVFGRCEATTCWRRPKTDPLIEVMPIQN